MRNPGCMSARNLDPRRAKGILDALMHRPLPRLLLGLGFLFASRWVPAAERPPVREALLRGEWPASWIACPEGPERDPAVFHFRKSLILGSVPQHLVVHVSADNRYLLHVNGRRVGAGPARSDVLHWAFETSRSWEAALDPGHLPNPAGVAALRARHFYYAAGPGEARDGARWDWEWDQPGSRSSRWQPAREIGRGHPRE